MWLCRTPFQCLFLSDWQQPKEANTHMKLVGLTFAFLVALFFFGEAVLLAGYVAVIVGVWFWSDRPRVWLVTTVICGTALLLHLNGYKLYGRAVVIAGKESLTNPLRVVALAPPSRLIFQDGSSVQLTDVFFPK